MENQSASKIFKQALMWGLGVATLVTLAFFTSSIHAMALCMMKAPVDWEVHAPVHHCTIRAFGDTPERDLKVQICGEAESSAVTFYLKNTTLRSFLAADAVNLVTWLRQCYRPSNDPQCPIHTTNRPDCPAYTPFTLTDYLCHHNRSISLVINGFRLQKESNAVVSFLLRHR